MSKHSGYKGDKLFWLGMWLNGTVTEFDASDSF
jgi:hypothetical protein